MTTADQIQALLQGYLEAYRNKDAAACAACYAPDAVLYSSYAAPARGRLAIEGLHRDWLSDGGEDKTLDILQSGSDQNSAWCVARFADGDRSSEGFSLNVFERDATGIWLIKASSLSEYPE